MPGRAQVQLLNRLAAHRPQAALAIGNLGAGEQPQHPGDQWRPDHPMRPGHRPLGQLVGQPVAHHQVVPLVKRCNQGVQLRKFVRAVAVAHHHVAALRLAEAPAKRSAVAPLGLLDDSRPGLRSDRRRTVRRAVVDDDHLALHPRAADPVEGLAYALGDAALLVQAGHDDGDVHLAGSLRRYFVGDFH